MTDYQKPKEIKPEHQEFMTKIGEKLQKLREGKNMSSTELAKKAGVSRNGYHQLETGQVYFTISTLIQVLDFHHVDLMEFFREL